MSCPAAILRTLPSFMKYSVKISRIILASFGPFLPTCDTIEEEKTPRELPFFDLQLPRTSSPCKFTESTKPGGI